MTEPRYSALGGKLEVVPGRPHHSYLTCDHTPIVKIGYTVFDRAEADEAMREPTFMAYANSYLDVEVMRPGQGWIEVVPDGVGSNDRTLVGRVRRHNRYGRVLNDYSAEVVRYRVVIKCPGCGEPVTFRVEKLLRALWLRHPHIQSVPHRFLPTILKVPDQA